MISGNEVKLYQRVLGATWSCQFKTLQIIFAVSDTEMTRWDNGAISPNSFISPSLKLCQGGGVWAGYPEQSREYWAWTLSLGKTAELYQKKNRKAVPSDVWRMNWLSFGAGGHLKALQKWGWKGGFGSKSFSVRMGRQWVFCLSWGLWFDCLAFS